MSNTNLLMTFNPNTRSQIFAKEAAAGQQTADIVRQNQLTAALKDLFTQGQPTATELEQTVGQISPQAAITGFTQPRIKQGQQAEQAEIKALQTVLETLVEKGATNALGPVIQALSKKSPTLAKVAQGLSGKEIDIGNKKFTLTTQLNEDRTVDRILVSESGTVSPLLGTKGEVVKAPVSKLSSEELVERGKIKETQKLSLVEKTFNLNEQLLSQKPVLQQLKERGASNGLIESINASDEFDGMIERVKANIEAIPKNKLGAMALAVKKNTFPAFNDPELQKLSVSLQMLIQSVVKAKQGSRPSDRDLQVITDAIGNVAAGRATFEGGLDELSESIKVSRKSIQNMASNFGVDIGTMRGFEPTQEVPAASEQIPQFNSEAEARRAGLKNGDFFMIFDSKSNRLRKARLR